MNQQPIRAIIVDDEPLARKSMRDLLQAHPEIVIVGEAARLHEARTLVADTSPDLVFLDIQLYGDSGFDLLDDIPETTTVFFVTAFDRYALRAFEVNALDYLLKPVSPERLSHALKRLPAPPSLTTLTIDDSLYLQVGRKRWFESITNISLFFADSGSTCIVLNDGRTIIVRRSLNEWEEQLPAEAFMRVHRNALIQLSCVCDVKKMQSGVLLVSVLGATDPVEVSRRRATEFRHRIKEQVPPDCSPL